MKPLSREEFLNKIKDDKEFNLKYGRKTFINQIQYVIDRLKTHPDCRRLIVSAWTVQDLEKMALMPCHYGFQLRSYDLSDDEKLALSDKPGFGLVEDMPDRCLDLIWNQRSCDWLLGIPFNIASYGFLLHMIAQQAGMIPRNLIGSFGDVHLYDNHLEYVDDQLSRDDHKYSYPQLELDMAESIFDYTYEDFHIKNYESYPNWKPSPPIAI